MPSPMPVDSTRSRSRTAESRDDGVGHRVAGRDERRPSPRARRPSSCRRGRCTRAGSRWSLRSIIGRPAHGSEGPLCPCVPGRRRAVTRTIAPSRAPPASAPRTRLDGPAPGAPSSKRHRDDVEAVTPRSAQRGSRASSARRARADAASRRRRAARARPRRRPEVFTSTRTTVSPSIATTSISAPGSPQAPRDDAVAPASQAPAAAARSPRRPSASARGRRRKGRGSQRGRRTGEEA